MSGMSLKEKKNLITDGRTALGIEFGSTNIKAVLTDLSGNVLAHGSKSWENTLSDGIWTYSIDEINSGARECYSALKRDVMEKYGIRLRRAGAMGVSAMMHGYMPFDSDGRLISPFQTWRNTNTQEAADALTELFGFNIPLRWSIAHLYQCILDGEEHVKDISFLSILSTYIHWKLTGNKVVGIGDASGMFPVDPVTRDYDAEMIRKFDDLIAEKNYTWGSVKDILPVVMTAGETAGYLTEEGAAFLDESGDLEPGIPMCPPEGDAGTGMTATNSVRVRTGNVSAGTSTFAMVVLEKNLEGLHREIDIVSTPSGLPVAMSHANNGTTDLNAWVEIFRQFSELSGQKTDTGDLYSLLYNCSLSGDADCGGLLAYGYYSGENVTMINEGRPLLARMPESHFTLANLMRVNLYTSLGAVKIGMDILMKDEHVKIDRITGHGGFFKTKGVGQRYLAAAVNAPVTVMETAGEGGPWGEALLAAYMLYMREHFSETDERVFRKSYAAEEKSTGEAADEYGEDYTPGQRTKGNALSLEDYLDEKIFRNMSGTTMNPDPDDVRGFEKFTERYRAGLDIERAAVECMKYD